MIENEVARIVVAAGHRVHKGLGPGLYDTAYQNAMWYELTTHFGYEVKRNVPVPLFYKGVKVDMGYFADLVVNEKVIVEIISRGEINRDHEMEMMTYLRLSNLKLGLLLNFREVSFKNGIRRVINNFPAMRRQVT